MNRLKIEKQSGRSILFIVGANTQSIRSELYRPDQSVLVEDCPLERLERAIEEADVVYLYDISLQRRDPLVLICYAHDKEFYCRIKSAGVILLGGKVTRDYDSPVIYHRRSHIFGIEGRIKRLMDIILSLVALIVLLPVFGTIALCIKLDDGGPVFYRQIRCTKGGRKFEIIKFRSMVSDAERDIGAVRARSGDDRRTRVGKVLRCTKLDELPQLINILRGEMSIVGPRPERPELIEEALINTPEFLLRTKVAAGLTGYAQVYGYYNTSFEEKLKWDLMYIENFSLLLDIKLILMTIPSIIWQETYEDKILQKAEIPELDKNTNKRVGVSTEYAGSNVE